MQRLKDELEDLAFAELNPDARDLDPGSACEFLRAERRRSRRARSSPNCAAKLEQTTGSRPRSPAARRRPSSIWHKMQRKNVAFEQLSDIMAFRVVVDSDRRMLPRARRHPRNYRVVPGRFKDYISTPKPNGYRSLHTDRHRPEQRSASRCRSAPARCTTWPNSASPRTGTTSRSARKRTDGRQYRWLRELLEILEHAAGAGGVPRAHQARDVPGPGVLLHAARAI